MKDAQDGDRELQATNDRKKGTRTTAMTIQVDLGRLKAARRTWRGNTSEFIEIEPKSQPELADQPAALSSRAYPTFFEPSSQTRAGFDHPAPVVLNAHQ